MASIRKRPYPDGTSKWVVDYKDAADKRCLKTFGTKRAADTFRNKVIQELEQGTHVSRNATITVAEVAALFLKHTQGRVQDGRLLNGRARNIEAALRNTLLPRIGRRNVSDLTHADIMACYEEPVRVGLLLPRTARDRLVVLKQVQDFAIKNGYMKTKPVDDVLSDLRGLKHRKVRSFTIEQVKSVLRATDARPKNREARTTATRSIIVHLAAICGFRYGEISGLLVSNIDLDRGILKVRNSYSKHDGLKGPKTAAGVRDFPLPRQVGEMIMAYLRDYHSPNKLGLLIATRGGKPLSASHFHGTMWQPLLRSVGMEDLDDRYHFHALRHFATSMLAASGVPLTDIPEMMGHSHLDTTLKTYCHAVMTDDARAERLASVMARISAPLLQIPDAGRDA